MIGYIVDVEFVWGFQARIVGLSKTSPSFYYPPPTTFLGALAETVAKDERIGEREGKKLIPKLSENLLAIGFRPINCVPIKYEDLNRIVAVKITSGILYPNPKDLSKSFDSPARGKTVLSSLDDNAPTVRWFLVFKDDRIKLDGKEITLSEEHFWKIHRLGSKESRVSVADVLRLDGMDIVESETVITNYSFPVNRNIKPVDEVQQKWEYEVYVNPFEIRRFDEKENPVTDYISGKNTLPFRVPIMVTKEPEYAVELTAEATAYEFKGEVVIGWSR
jgi:CRISPR-associated protein Cas5a/b/c